MLSWKHCEDFILLNFQLCCPHSTITAYETISDERSIKECSQSILMLSLILIWLTCVFSNTTIHRFATFGVLILFSTDSAVYPIYSECICWELWITQGLWTLNVWNQEPLWMHCHLIDEINIWKVYSLILSIHMPKKSETIYSYKPKNLAVKTSVFPFTLILKTNIIDWYHLFLSHSNLQLVGISSQMSAVQYWVFFACITLHSLWRFKKIKCY